MRKLVVLCVGLLSLTLLVGCGDDEGDSESDRSTGATAAPSVMPPGMREQAPMPQKLDNRGQGRDSVAMRKEVITGSVNITADEPIAAAGQVADRVREAGGRIDSRTEQSGTDDTDPSAKLTVRVSADKTDAFIDRLEEIGCVTRASTNRDDVTMQWEDLDARIRALQASVDRLRALITGATNTADLIATEQALSSRQGELDSLTAQKRHLDDQVVLSTLTIDIIAKDKDSDDGPTNFWAGVVASWHSLVDWLKDAIVFTGKAVPWVGFLALIGVVVWGIVLLMRCRGRVGSTAGHPAESFAGTSAAAESAEPGTETGAADGGKGNDQAEQP